MLPAIFEKSRPRRYRRKAAAQAHPVPPPEDDVLTGTILPYAGAIVPPGYLPCDGAAVSRATYAALFIIIGTAYGAGDGSTTFNLPDLRCRTAVGEGSAPGMTPRARGDRGGSEVVQLTADQLAPHAHSYNEATGLTASTATFQSVMDASAITEVQLETAPSSSGEAGGGNSHENMPPFAVVKWIVKA